MTTKKAITEKEGDMTTKKAIIENRHDYEEGNNRN